jgi:hypothetical protein
VQEAIIFLADWLPLATLVTVAGVLLWGYVMEGRPFAWGDLFPLGMSVLMVLIILHVVIAVFLPLRWPAIRTEFQRQLERRLQADLEEAYACLPGEVAQTMKQERHQVEDLLSEVAEVVAWLEKREQAASIAAMYGR